MLNVSLQFSLLCVLNLSFNNLLFVAALMASQRKGSSESAPSDFGFLKQFHHLPKLVVFDLDFTLWPFHVDKLKPPLRPLKDGNSVDSELTLISLYPEVKDILQSMSKHFLLAVASRVEDITVAYQLLSFCQISSYFPLKEIYPTSKSIHLKRLQARSGHHAHEMLFFDDDKRNIRDSKNIGVQAVQVLNGLSWHVVIDGLSLFSQSQSSI
uniref:Magnesium-dependent phosphatase-1 n=2 Tax=Homalodisca liturata TaxID=320908 RepID=A0A1B6HJS9_9HEMI